MRLKTLVLGLAALVLVGGAAPPPEEKPLSADEAAYIENQRAILNSLRPQRGLVKVPEASVTLNLGDFYYFLDAKDAKRVLIEGWDNPPSAAEGVLGMVFPKGKTYLDDTWGAVVTYIPEGHVSDSDHSDADFERVAKAFRDSEDDINAQRKKEGAEPLHFVGWARQPTYDAASHTAIWARELQFGDSPDHTLNYDMRVLGRRGSFSLNVVAGMDKLKEVEPAAATLKQTASFDPGSRYEEFDPAVDQAAEYGVAGMIAAGAGVLLAKKLGVLAFLALFLKKGAVLVLAALAGVANWLRKQFGRKRAAPAAPLALNLDEPAVVAGPPAEPSPPPRAEASPPA